MDSECVALCDAQDDDNTEEEEEDTRHEDTGSRIVGDCQPTEKPTVTTWRHKQSSCTL